MRRFFRNPVQNTYQTAKNAIWYVFFADLFDGRVLRIHTKMKMRDLVCVF